MRVIILRGISGAGKSTFLPVFINENNLLEENVIVASADHLFENRAKMLGESYLHVFDPSDLPKAHAQCLVKFVELLARCDEPLLSDEDVEEWHEQVVVVDNTNIGVAEMAPYIALAQAYDCEVEVICLWATPEAAHKRSSHKVSFEVILGQYKQLLRESLPPWWPKQRIVLTG